METQMTKKESNLPSTDVAAWGEKEAVSSKDIVIPMILAMQYMSKKVKDQKAKFGELRDTLANEVLGDNTKKLEFIPFHMEKVWIEKKDGKYLQTIPITAANEALPYDEGDITRDYVMYIYGIVPGDNRVLPYVIPFRGSSKKTGKQIYTIMTTNRELGLPPAATVMELTTTKKENDKGEFCVFEATPGRKAKPTELDKALKWFNTVRKGIHKVDEEGIKEDVDSTVANSEF